MGCGKTSLGKKLAKKMDVKFIDLDKILEKEEQMTVPEIFEVKGEPYFREIESQWLSKFNEDDTIISLGGGTPCYHDNMKLINAIGNSIYLKMDASVLTERLYNSTQKRPLIDEFKDNKVALSAKIESMLAEREKFYAKANITFEASNVSSSKLDCLVELIVN